MIVKNEYPRDGKTIIIALLIVRLAKDYDPKVSNEEMVGHVQTIAGAVLTSCPEYAE